MRARIVAAALAGIAAVPAPAAATVPRGKLFTPALHADGRDRPESPLDLRRVAFAQRGTQLWLKVRTAAPWSAAQLAEEDLCLDLLRPGRASRLCVGSEAGRAALRHHGDGRDPVPLRAVVNRPGQRTLVARFYPRALGTGFGGVRWIVRSRSEGGTDRAPDDGSYGARISAYGGPRCFGAAARAARGRCVNRALRRRVVPRPRAAAILPDEPCTRVRSTAYRVIVPCEVGDTTQGKPPRIALIGDSHSAHWRSAVDVAAHARGWRAVSITHPGCSFSSEVYPAPPPIPARCRTHTSEALEWLRAHPTVRTVVTSSSAGRGLSPGGYLTLWSQVPASVRRIHVIRDVPRVSHTTAGCVGRALRRRRGPARACSVPRAGAFPADEAAQAARRAPGRVRLLDFSRFFCSGTRCLPVVGGAYVYRDDNHMNPVFNATLGPFLLRALRGSARRR